MNGSSRRRFRYRVSGAALATVVAVAGWAGAATAASASGHHKHKSSGHHGHHAKADKPSIPIGVMADTANPVGTGTQPTTPNTVNDWSSYVNAHGGIDGHPVKVYMEEDPKGNAAVESADVHKLVQTDHVVAIMDGSVFDTTWQTYPASVHIPVIDLNVSASATLKQTYETKPDFFANGTTVDAILYGQVAIAKAAGGKVFGGIYCTNVPQCKSAVTLWKADTKIIPGMKFGLAVGATETAPTYTAQCLSEEQAGVDALFPIVRATATANSCAEQNYHPIYVGSQGTIANSMASDPNLDGAVQNEQGFPWMMDKTKAQKLFHKIEKKALAHAMTPPQVSAAYTGLVMLEKVLAHAPSGKVTAKDVYKGLYSLDGTTLGGLSATPLKFTKTKPNPQNCYFVVTVKNKKWEPFKGGKPECEPKKYPGA